METETFADADVSVEAYDDIEVPTEGVAAEGGQVDEVVEPTEPARVVPFDEFSDAMFDLGDGTLIPASELRGGGLRQADYTKKTQEAAEIRKQAESALAMVESLRANPRGTLNWLASELGVSLQEAQAIQQAATQPQEDNWWDDEPSGPSPLDQRLAAIEQRMLQEDVKREVDSTFSRLKAKYGDDFNEQEVARAATEREIYDPRFYEMVFRDLQYEKIMAGRQAATQEMANRAAQEAAARRAAAAQAASATGASGGSAATAPAAPPAPARQLTTREAAELAWQQLYGDE